VEVRVWQGLKVGEGWFMFGMKFGERYGGLKVEVMEVLEAEVKG